MLQAIKSTSIFWSLVLAKYPPANLYVMNVMNGRIGKKTWCKFECCAPMETTIDGSAAKKFLRFASQDFQIYRVWTFADQIHILCYDILDKKTSLVIWFPPNADPWDQIKVSLQTSQLSFSVKHFTLLLNQIFFWPGRNLGNLGNLGKFFPRFFNPSQEMFFVSVLFQKSIRLDSGGSLFLKNNILSTVWITRSSHSQVLKKLLNVAELYEIHF